MKPYVILAAAAGLVIGCTPTVEEPLEPIAAAVDPADPLFAPGYMRMAASSDLFEVESSRLALARAQSPAHRQFAQMMINDHTRTTQELMAAAQTLGVAPPPPAMLPHHAAMLERLRAAGPTDFDRAYKTEQLVAHQEALTLHRNYADQGDAEPLRAVAARAVPIIEMHYGHAQSLSDYAPAPAPLSRAGERG